MHSYMQSGSITDNGTAPLKIHHITNGRAQNHHYTIPSPLVPNYSFARQRNDQQQSIQISMTEYSSIDPTTTLPKQKDYSNSDNLANLILNQTPMNHIRNALNATTNTVPQIATAATLNIHNTTNQKQQALQTNPKPYYPDEQLVQEILNVDFNFNIHEPAITEPIPLTGIHPTLGLDTTDDKHMNDTVRFNGCIPGTIAHKTLKCWKSRLRNSIIRMINNTTITSKMVPL
mmetsp:Transcript_5974/g.9127  ORF Transcript_5974/g.9127 Transcript_5974/m.9127 type:complete len:231 (-) Transcript_5974:3227-3919(-)